SIVLTRLSPLYFGGNQTACHLPRGRALNGRNNFCRDPAIWPQEEIACAILNLLPSGDFTLVGYVSRKPPREGIDDILGRRVFFRCDKSSRSASVPGLLTVLPCTLPRLSEAGTPAAKRCWEKTRHGQRGSLA